MKKLTPTHDRIIFWVGVLGLIVYATGLLPRQPELLPVYTAMMGVGTLLKKGDDKGNDSKH